MSFQQIDISIPTKFFPVGKLSQSEYYIHLKNMQNLSLKDYQSKEDFLNFTCKEIVENELINKMAFTDSALIEAFAYIFVKNYKNIIKIIPEEVMLKIVKSTAFEFLEGWTESLKIILMCRRLDTFITHVGIALICEEAVNLVEKVDNELLCNFLVLLFENPRRLYSRKHFNGIEEFKTSFNKLLMKIAMVKPIVFASSVVNSQMRGLLKLDTLAPSPEYILRHPDKCPITSSLTISVILGHIIAIIQNNENLEYYFNEIFALAPHQTKDCLIFYILHHNKDFLSKLDKYNDIAKIFCYENGNRSIYEMPFFVNCIDKIEVDFFEQPTSEKMNVLISKGIDLERVVGLGILNAGDLVFDKNILFDALDQVINSMESDLKSLEYIKFTKMVRTALTLIEAIIQDVGFLPDLIEPFAIIIDDILISHIPFETKQATFITAEIERVLYIINVLVLKNTELFVSFALENKDRLSSLWIITACNCSFIEHSLDIVTLFASALKQPSWISLHLATKMIIHVVESIEEEDLLAAIRVAYSVLDFCKNCLILFSSELVGECYFLRVLKKLFKCRLFCSTFVEYDDFFIPLIDIINTNEEESIFLVYQVITRMMLADCPNDIVCAMFYFPPINILRKMIMSGKRFLESTEPLVANAVKLFMRIVNECPFTASILGIESSSLSLNVMKEFLKKNFPTCHDRVIASIKAQSIQEEADFDDICSMFS